LLHLNIKKFSTSTTTPHTPATLLNTKKIPFNISFAQTLVWAKPLFGAKKHGLCSATWEHVSRGAAR
ncbi:hypothetical protein MXL87_27930, partial [Klebsiella variicola]|uniref:hypothetical protein n=1 Tax=Klebsiella variicola TaxID=244366 RepID=UPI002DB663D8